MSRLHYVTPAALLLVPLALAAFALWGRRLGGVLTLAAALCLCVALARPQWATETRRVARLYALDVSGSMFLDTPKALAAVRRSMADLGSEDRAGLLVFAGSPLVSIPPTRPGSILAELWLPGQPVRPDATDIAEAVRTGAQQLADAAFDRQLVLLSDGRQTRGNAELEAALVADSGVRIFAVPVGPGEVADARVALLRAPARVRVGEAFAIEVELAATAPMEAALSLTRDGALLGEPRPVALQPGLARRLVVEDRLNAPGTRLYAASLAVADRCAENNSALAIVRAEGATRVIYLAPGNPALARLLSTAPGVEVRRLGPPDYRGVVGLLPGADCLVLDGAAAEELPHGDQQAIRDWVRDTGAGLIAIGGPASYGPGGYAGTAIEEALPVLCSRPRKLAILVALDASGSMAERVPRAPGAGDGSGNGRGKGSKIAFAREAVLRCVGWLHEADSFGLLAFAGEPRVVQPLGPVPKPDRLAPLLDEIEPHGPTELGAALERVLAILAGAPAQVRHAILVSDGQVTDDQAKAIRAAGLKDRMAKAGVTLSALMTGRDAKAIDLLKELAGDGFQFVEDPANLSKALLEELRKAAYASLLRQGKAAARAAPGAEVARGVVPGSLGGYVRTFAKPAAAVEWLAGEPPDPLVARWQFGLGRSLAFASTVGTRWDEGLWGTDGLSRLWTQAVRWAARPPRTPGFEAEAAERGDEFLLTVRAERVPIAGDGRGRFLNALDLTARIAPPRGNAVDVPLRQTAPGEYQATFPAAAQGAYHATVVERGNGQRLTLSVAKNYAHEWESFGVDASALEAIARNGQGKVLSGLDELREIAPRTAPGRAEIAWLFLAAGLVLFVGKVALSVARSKRTRL